MKKIVLVGLITFLIISCGKIERGIITIENKSTHLVKVEFAQNYSSEFITLSPSTSVERSWERYFFCFIKNTNKHILEKKETKEKITIFNNDRLHSYKVMNGVPDLTMLELLDDNQFILALPDGTPTSSIILNPGLATINTFLPLSTKNMVFNKGTPFNIGSDTYYPIEKKGEIYYFNKFVAGKLESKKININLIGNEIIISN